MTGKNSNEIEVKVGEMIVTKSPAILKTILGSCVAVILFDKINKVGGLSHVFLPNKLERDKNEPDSKFADTAVPILIQECIKNGAKKAFLMGYLVGGGNLLKKINKSISVADKNVEITKKALHDAGIILLGCTTGDNHGYKVRFDLSSGDLIIEDLKGIDEI